MNYKLLFPTYRNRYLFLVQCREGRIAHILEYSNPQVFREAHAEA